MITNIKIRNFKKLGDIELDIGPVSVFVGPNNSGKTSALQALSLWNLGLKKWLEKRQGGPIPQKRPGVTLNRYDLTTIPVSATKLLWKNKSTRQGSKTNIRIDIIVEGITDGRNWKCGLEFDYQNEETILCRPIKLSDSEEGISTPDAASIINVAFLPPMSGIASDEDKLESGSINTRIGQGLTAEVLRNLCLQLFEKNKDGWDHVCNKINSLFGISINAPIFKTETGKIHVTYTENDNNTVFDLSSSGRGMHQTLLLLTWLHLNPASTLLLDEPDAHLELIRQGQIYDILSDSAHRTGGQILIASHSEKIMNQAGDRDVLIAFIGNNPHRIDNNDKTHVRKSLSEIGFDQYYQAEQKGAVIYVEGSTDHKILLSLAQKLNHQSKSFLENAFVCHVGNQYSQAEKHYFGLRVATPHLKGFVVLDRQTNPPNIKDGLPCHLWTRNEIENYLCYPESLYSYAENLSKSESAGPLFDDQKQSDYLLAMKDAVQSRIPPAALENYDDSFWIDTKVSDTVLPEIFKSFFKKINLPNLMNKTDYHLLAEHVPEELISGEIREVLNKIHDYLVAQT